MSTFSVVTGSRFGSPAKPLKEAAPQRCPVELTLDALQGRYRPLIVWHLFWGARPFSDLMRNIPGITKKTLRRELVEMDRRGLIRRDIRLGSNRKADYSLTPLGQSLKPLVGAMYEWGLHRLTGDTPRVWTAGPAPRPREPR